MNIFGAMVLGLVEGITEFLPVSSTFHLIWVSRILHIPQTDFQKLFEIVIQSGAILSVFVLYYKMILTDRDLVKKIVVSFIPTAVVGLVLYKVIKGVLFENYMLQIGVFVLVGIIFILFERKNKNHHYQKGINALSYRDAVIVGVIQSFAIIPGVSRAGAVILSMMMLDVKRDEAAKYSFLLAIPTILAASALDLFKMRVLLIGQIGSFVLILVGFIAAFASALLVIRWFIRFLQKNTLSPFGWYRIVLAVILLILFQA